MLIVHNQFINHSWTHNCMYENEINQSHPN